MEQAKLLAVEEHLETLSGKQRAIAESRYQDMGYNVGSRPSANGVKRIFNG